MLMYCRFNYETKYINFPNLTNSLYRLWRWWRFFIKWHRFFFNHAGSIWYEPSGFWLRINNDSTDDYYSGKCVRLPLADGTFNDFFSDVQFNQTIVRNEANFVYWNLQFIGENPDYTDGTLSYSVDAGGNKLTVTYTAGGGYIYTKVNDTFPGTDCKN